jgi:hypothetical protein
VTVAQLVIMAHLATFVTPDIAGVSSAINGAGDLVVSHVRARYRLNDCIAANFVRFTL